jgi:hypothetical protein
MKVGISSVEGEVPAFLFESIFQSVETKSLYYLAMPFRHSQRACQYVNFCKIWSFSAI